MIGKTSSISFTGNQLSRELKYIRRPDNHAASHERWAFLFDTAAINVGHDNFSVKGKTALELVEIASCANTPALLLGILTMHPNSYIRESVAANSSATPEILAVLSNDPVLHVRIEVAANTRTPVGVLAEMSRQGSHVRIRRAVASNASSSEDILHALSKDPDTETRCNVASNVSTPVDLLRTMAGELDTSKDDHNHHNTKAKVRIRCHIARNINAPEDVLLLFTSKHENIKVMCEVALNPSASAIVLERLAAMPYEYVRYDVAANHNIPDHILAQLAKDQSERVKLAVALNPNSSLETLKLIRSDNPDLMHSVEMAINERLEAYGILLRKST